MVDMGEETPQPKKSKSDASAESPMDALPVSLLGSILSQMACARHIAVASATCRKWQEAARYHIHKLRFDDWDWPTTRGLDEAAVSRVRELLIVNKVMRTTHLSELCIGFRNGVHACAVIACLLHTKRTLRSFTLVNQIMPNVNILETLAGGGGVLECLEWAYAYIPILDPHTHCVPSLVSLTLDDVVSGLSAHNLLVLFSVFPKLESLSIIETSIVDAPSTIHLNLCSLQKLTLYKIRLIDTTLVLYDPKLGRLSVKKMCDGLVRWMRREGSKSMQYLQLYWVDVVEFEAGDSLGYLKLEFMELPSLQIKGNLQQLILEDVRVCATVSVENLVSLSELVLTSDDYIEAGEPHAYYEILAKVSSKLSKLTIWGPELDLDAIAVAHPYVCKLGLDYPNIAYDASAIQPLLFREVTVLEVFARMYCVAEDFAGWISGLLNRFPNLKALIVSLNDFRVCERHKFMGALSSSLVQMMRPYPHINVSFQYL